MLEEKIPIHYVCTHDEAKELIKNHDKFWISNCGCREGLGSKCTRSRIDVCLSFTETDEASGSEKNRLTESLPMA